jgi:hypothetical protein
LFLSRGPARRSGIDLGARQTRKHDRRGSGHRPDKIEDDFWASKTGQKLLKDRVERSFPEFIARVPAGLLGDSGLKRHYKLPEPVKVLRAPVKKG